MKNNSSNNERKIIYSIPEKQCACIKVQIATVKLNNDNNMYIKKHEYKTSGPDAMPWTYS